MQNGWKRKTHSICETLPSWTWSTVWHWRGPRSVNTSIINLRFYFAEKFQLETEKLGSLTGLKPEFNLWFGNAGFRMLLFLHPTEKKMWLFWIVTNHSDHQLAGEKAVQTAKAAVSVALFKVWSYSIEHFLHCTISEFQWRKYEFGVGLRLSELL